MINFFRKKDFIAACSKNRNAIYGIMGVSQLANNQVNATNGTAFMIAPGILATVEHLTHIENDIARPNHNLFEVIRAPDIGQGMERAQLIAEDTGKDIALFRIDNPRSNSCIALKTSRVSIGTECGSLGFPLARVIFTQGRRNFNLIERFQGAHISAFCRLRDPNGQEYICYETDALMYNISIPY